MLNLWSWKNKITHLPEKGLQDLEQLTIASSERIENIEHLVNCPKLRILDLGLSKNNSIPRVIADLTQLVRLSIYGDGQNTIRSIPDEIANLPKLQSLTIWNNGLPKSRQKELQRLLPQCQFNFR